MNRHTNLMILLAIMITFAGCGATAREIARMSQSVRNDVFAEIASEGPAAWRRYPAV